MGIECPKCHFDNPDDTVYCGKCATSLPSSKEIPVTKTLETPTDRLTKGTTFASRYEIIEELGKGGMGRVYRVKDEKLDEEMALKVLKPEIAADKGMIERFKNELKLARKIAHRNVCKMYDLNEEEEIPYITMEYVKGEDLKSYIRKKGKISEDDAISIAKQVCEGLAEAHELGVIHRDLKPQNIMIDEKSNAKVMDFGIARSVEAPGITQTGMMIGTPDYISPEQAEGEEADQRSDIYALGVILYEMVTGSVPFKGDTALSVALKHKSQLPREPRKLNPEVSENLNRLILKCMEKDKKRRYQNTEELLSDLRDLEKGLSPDLARGNPFALPLKRKVFIPALVIVSLAIIIIIIWQLLPRKEMVPSEPFKPSIAVLPFDDLSPQEDQGYLCDGFAESLINALTKVKDLRVPASTSSFSFRGKERDMQEIGEKLNVNTVFRGSVQKAGNRVRIIAQIINVADESLLWSEQYNREMDDVFAIQDEITLAIVDKLKLELLGGEKAKLVKRHTENLEAYNLYLKGRYFWNKRTAEDMKKSARYFEQAIEEDPMYALAYAGLALSYVTLGEWDILPSKEAYPKAKVAAKKALEIDNSLAEAYVPLGAVKCNVDWDWKGAEREYKLAIELNPNDAYAHQWYSEYLVMMGRLEEAIREINRAQELDPLSLNLNAVEAFHLYSAREYDRGIEQCRKVLEMDPNFLPAQTYIGLNYLGNGMYEEALEEFKKNDLFNQGEIAITYAKMGKITEAKKLLKNCIERVNKEGVPGMSYFIACIYFALGEDDQGFKWFERAYEKRERGMVFIKTSPFIDSVRSDSRFKAMLRKMNLE